MDSAKWNEFYFFMSYLRRTGCQDVVKKPKLDTHYQRCHASVTCVDCSTTFGGPKEWKSHTQCISEAEKYQKGLYKGKKTVCDLCPLSLLCLRTSERKTLTKGYIVGFRLRAGRMTRKLTVPTL